MRITAKVDYAVRLCVELAARGEGGYVKADELSSAQGVSLAYVLGILNTLKQAGIVESRRGADGGTRLAAPASEIVVADVIRAIDGPLATVGGRLVESVEYEGRATAVRDVWVALRASLRSVLDTVTLEDVASGRLPEPAASLLADDGAWATRPHGRDTERAGVRRPS
ncbi:Rrf2 family transcriptional regulator [Cellulomonas sp. PhB143]|uniref:RrF2 family transcriptional regulator n=1 Tax=Cellulomonas sp. PhB143 TaxID=2485186 RepID=UPI000F487338|nr:Rrf2 family transcriptional regulator [Cellulomonas sp. PhB143]ROS75446.1 BadM/Rrf2 family transcriptional regulator [Cellulomonas sp. PhB143]